MIFNFHSIDFLLPYSFHQAENPQIHIPIHHFGDIIKTDAINTHQSITITMVRTVITVFIIQQHKIIKNCLKSVICIGNKNAS
jgi:hypothetical protein